MTKRHKIFVSYHHDNDQEYRDQFEAICKEADISVIRSVQIGDIDANLKTETIRQKVRDNYLRDSTVTIVLIGSETWKRKHVDWEIGSSIRKTQYNPRSGLIGIFLPTHPDNGGKNYDKCRIPPRLYDNQQCEFATLHNWNTSSSTIQDWIHEAFNRRDTKNPDNSYETYRNNRKANAKGWC